VICLPKSRKRRRAETKNRTKRIKAGEKWGRTTLEKINVLPQRKVITKRSPVIRFILCLLRQG
jgi:hypothetical protein